MSGAFPTGEQIYDRLKWDERFDLDRVQIVFSLRPTGTKVVPYREFDLTTIPWHRIVEYRLDGELLWSRHARVDRSAALATKTGFRRSAAGGDIERVEPALLETTPLTLSEGPPGARVEGLDASSHPERAKRVEGLDAPATLRVATWNVLFDRFDAELLDSDRRWTVLLDELAASNADLIALQEVTPGFLKRLLDTEWIRQDYWISDATGSSVDPHGQVLLSRFPIVECSITRLAPHRRLLWARVAAGPIDLGVCVVHLASDRASGAAETRADELRAVAGHVRATPRGAWIVLGDFNSIEEENVAVVRGLDAVDAWRSLRTEPGLTFDFERNALAGALSQRRRSGRFDRILSIAGGGTRFRPSAVRLLGETPSAGGLFASDHFGVFAELVPERAAGAGLDAAPSSKRAALVLVPPVALWGPLQRVRCLHDRGFARWPPHVTLIWEFLDPAWLDEAGQRIDALVSGRRPFEIAFDRAARLEQSGETTLVLEPSGTGRAALLSLRGELLALFPQLQSDREYRPHLTMGRVQKGTRDAAITADIERAGESLRWTLDRLTILARGEEGPLEVVHESIFAGARRAARRPSPSRDLLTHVAATVERVAGRPLPVEPFGSTRYAPSLATDLDLLVIAGRRDDPPAFASRVAAALVSEPAPNQVAQPNLIEGRFAGAGGSLREVRGDGVIGLRGRLGDREVDVTLVFADSMEAADDRMLPEGARRALLGPRDADVLVDRLKRHGRYEVFLAMLPMVKRWTDARAIRSNAFGYTSTFGWALLLAPPLLHDEKLCRLDADHALPAWFEWLAAIPEGADVTLDPAFEIDATKRLRVRSPAAPFRNAGRSFTGSTESVLRNEFSLVVKRTRSVTTSADALERAAVALEDDLPKGTLAEIHGSAGVRGTYEGAFHSLLVALEKAHGDRVRPWGRVSEEGAGWVHRFVVDGASPDEIRKVADPWLERFTEARPRLSFHRSSSP